MIDIIVGELRLQLSPYQRDSGSSDYDNWMHVFVEYKLPVLSMQYSTAFMIAELVDFKRDIQSLYDGILQQKPHCDVVFNPLERQLNLHIKQVGYNDIAAVNIIMKPENHVESVTVTDAFCLDQSYFPALLSGLDEIINWQN